MTIGGGEDTGKEKELEDAIMSITADKELAEWLVRGSVAGINSKEQEEKIDSEKLRNYCPGIESHITEIYSPPRVTSVAESF